MTTATIPPAAWWPDVKTSRSTDKAHGPPRLFQRSVRADAIGPRVVTTLNRRRRLVVTTHDITPCRCCGGTGAWSARVIRPTTWWPAAATRERTAARARQDNGGGREKAAIGWIICCPARRRARRTWWWRRRVNNLFYCLWLAASV